MSDIVDELKTGRGLTEGVMRDAWVYAKMQEAADSITALRAEVERLKAALSNYACTCKDGECAEQTGYRDECGKPARAALEGKP